MKKVVLFLFVVVVGFSCASGQKRTKAFTIEEVAIIEEAKFRAEDINDNMRDLEEMNAQVGDYYVIGFFDEKKRHVYFFKKNDYSYHGKKKILVEPSDEESSKAFYFTDHRYELVTEYFRQKKYSYTYILKNNVLEYFLKLPMEQMTRSKLLELKGSDGIKIEKTEEEFIKKKIELTKIQRKVIGELWKYRTAF